MHTGTEITMKYVVYIRSPQELRDRIRLFRTQISAYRTKIPSLEPHCTLMSVRCKESDEAAILESLESIAQDPFEITVEGSLELFDPNCLTIRIKPSHRLSQLHQTVIDRLKDFILWEETPPLQEPWASDSKRNKAYHTYGSPFFGKDFYTPHITIAEVDPEIMSRPKLLDKSMFADYAWTADSFIMIRKVKPPKILKTYELKKG